MNSDSQLRKRIEKSYKQRVLKKIYKARKDLNIGTIPEAEGIAEARILVIEGIMLAYENVERMQPK